MITTQKITLVNLNDRENIDIRIFVTVMGLFTFSFDRRAFGWERKRIARDLNLTGDERN